jgi:hypothetical protein
LPASAHVQPGVMFSGPALQRHVYPVVRNVIRTSRRN